MPQYHMAGGMVVGSELDHIIPAGGSEPEWCLVLECTPGHWHIAEFRGEEQG